MQPARLLVPLVGPRPDGPFDGYELPREVDLQGQGLGVEHEALVPLRDGAGEPLRHLRPLFRVDVLGLGTLVGHYPILAHPQPVLAAVDAALAVAPLFPRQSFPSVAVEEAAVVGETRPGESDKMPLFAGYPKSAPGRI